MKKTIKYLDNDGNYQYATVKDAGDLDRLKTKAKEDLVSAINELATNGITASDIDEINNKVDQIQQQANQNADALNMSDQERQEMQQQIAQMQAEVQAKVAELQNLAEEQDKKLQEASAELKKKADAIDVQKMQQDNAEALKNSAKALEDSLAATNEDLQKTADHLNEMEIQAGVVETSVKELQNGFESKVSSADFNEARTKLQEQETMVRQLNNELSTKASNNELDMVTQRVQKAESDIQQNAQGIKASVTKETMYKEMDDFAKYRENRLKYSRDFSNNWSLNGNDVIDDDHLFDTQHDVKSVSIRNGAYLTQTTDLDTDDMSKTFTLAMWVEKGKKPRAWYGSAELTNMKVKEDKGEYQRVYWTFVPTIVKQDIRITGDTSTQGNLIISEPKLEQSDRPSAWSTNTGDQYATTEKLAHDLKLTSDKLESTITKQSEFSDRQLQDESRITQTEHGLEVANKTIVSKTDGLRQEFDGKIDATSKSLTSEYQSFTNQAIGQMADGGSNLILNSSFGNLKNSYDKWTNVSPKVRIVEDDNGLKWAKMEQSGLTADSPIGLTSNLFRVKKGIVTVALDIRTDNAGAIDNDNIVILESYNADKKRVFTQEVGFSAFGITRNMLFDHGPHRVTYKYNQTRDDTQYMAVHIVLPKNGVLYVTNVLARTVANGEDSGEYAPNAADLHEQVVQQRTRIEQNDQAIALKADQTKVDKDISQAKADLTVKADGIAQNVANLTKSQDAVAQRVTNVETKADGIQASVTSVTNDLKNGRGSIKEGLLSMTDDHFSTKFSSIDNKIDGISVGGTNLLLNTKDFTGDWYQQGSASLQDLDGRKVIHAWADWSSYRTRQVIQLEQNTDYTISADIRSLDGNSSDNTVTIHGFLDGKDTQLGDLHTNGKLSSKQQRFSAVWHNNSAGQLTTFRLEGHGGWGAVHGSIYISHIKLEKGNKPTDWSPAPDDSQARIDGVVSKQAEFQTSIDGVKSDMAALKDNSVQYSKMTQDENGFSFTVGQGGQKRAIEIGGGENLLPNSGDQRTTDHWFAENTTLELVKHQFFQQGQKNLLRIKAPTNKEVYLHSDYVVVEPNAQYTVSFDAFGTGNVTSFDVWALGDRGDLNLTSPQWGGITTNKALLTGIHPSPSKTVRYSATFTNNTGDKRVLLRFDNNGTTNGSPSELYIGNVQIEKGEVATPWSPSSDDRVNANTPNDNLMLGTSPNWRRIPCGSGGGWWHLTTAETYLVDVSQYPTGTNLTYSIDVKNTSNHAIKVEGFWLSAANGGRISSSSSKNVTPGKTDSLMINLSNKPSNAVAVEVDVISTDDKTTAGQEVQMRNEKLEVGLQRTPWCASSGDKSGNLLEGTATFGAPGIWANTANQKFDGTKDPNGNVDAVNLRAYNGIAQAIYVKRGTYTFSAYVWRDTTDGAMIYTIPTNNITTQGYATIYNQATRVIAPIKSWQKVSFSFEVSAPGYIAPRVESETASRVWVGSYKLEKGLHTNSEWSENPSTVMSQILVNKDSISLKVDTGKVINSINTSTEGVKIDATKIQINGNTSISGTLNVPTVILKGKSGQIDLTGDNILVKGNSGSAQLLINSNELKLTNGSASGVRITPTSIVIGNENKFFSQFSGTQMGFYYKTDKLKDLGLLGVGFDLVQQKSFGLTLYANPAKDDYNGGEFIVLGYNDPNKNRSAGGVSQISLYAKDVYSDDKKQYTLKGIHINDHMYIHQDIDISNKTIYLPGEGLKIKVNGTQDPLFIIGDKFSNSMQSNYYQPTLMAGYSSDTHGDSGISFLWNSLKVFGTLDLTGTKVRVADANVTPTIGWVSFSKWKNIPHLALYHANSNGVSCGFAMSEDGVPVVFDTGSAAGWRGGQWLQ